MSERLPVAEKLSQSCLEPQQSERPLGTGENPSDGAPREHWADINGCRMRYLRTECETNQPPVLLIHGLLGYSFSWRFNIGALAQRRTVYAVDLPGVGFSQRSPTIDCSATGMAEILAGFLSEQQIEFFDVIATSHGGGIAMALAAAGERGFGPRVRRLVLSAPVNPWSPHGRLLTQFLATGVGAALFRCVQPGFASLHGQILARMYGDASRIRPGTLEGYEAPQKIDGIVDHLLRIMQSWRRDLLQMERLLPTIAHIPALLVWGGRDKAVLPESAVHLQRQFERAEIFMMPEAGHLPYEEMPEQFNSAVAEFLDRTD